MRTQNINTSLIFFLIGIGLVHPIIGKSILLESEHGGYSIDKTQDGNCSIFYDSLDIYNTSNIHEIPFVNRTEFTVFDPETDYKVWLKFTVKKDLSCDDSWAVYNVDQNVGGMKIYYFNKGNLKISGGGKDYPFFERDLPLKHIATTLNLAPGQKRTYYVCYTGKLYFLMHPRVDKIENIILFENKEYHLIAVCYGILLIMIIYNLIMFGVVKHRKYIFYVFYVIFTALFLTNGDSFLFQYLWPNVPIINTILFYFARPLWIFFFILYASTFLNLNPKTRKYLWLFFAVFTTFSIYEVIHYKGTHYYYFPIIYVWICLLSWQKYKKGEVNSIFFFLGSLLITIGVIDVTLLSKGIINNAGFWHYYGIYIAVIIEVVLYSISLAKQFNQHRKQEILNQKELILQLEEKRKLEAKVNRELEQKVAERTLELNDKNHKLTQLTDELNLLNKQLDITLWEKGKEVKKVATNLVIQGNLSFRDFTKSFPDDFTCLNFVCELKWNPDKEFECKNCGNTRWNKGNQVLSRKCSKCNRIESVTSHTIFHKLRFPLQKAFYLLYIVKQNDPKTLKNLAQELDLSIRTCSVFKQKVINKMNNLDSKNNEWEQIIC